MSLPQKETEAGPSFGMRAEIERRREVLCDAIMNTFSNSVDAPTLERVLVRLRSGKQDNLLLAMGLAMINFVETVKQAMDETFRKIETLAHMEPMQSNK